MFSTVIEKNAMNMKCVCVKLIEVNIKIYVYCLVHVR